VKLNVLFYEKSLFVTTVIFHKVVCSNTFMVWWTLQQPLCCKKISCWIQQWKNFENLSISAKVIGKNIVVPFWLTV